MNLSTQASAPILAAKIYSSADKRRIAYAFSDNSDLLFLDKKEIILGQIDECEKLLRFATDNHDRMAVENELEELKSILDLIH